jgi:non-specific protein-tyrosine kinase
MEIKRYLALVWRWAWLIILGGVIAGGGAYLVSKNTQKVYRASARFLIDEAPGATSGNDLAQILLEERLAQTYVEIIKTRPILAETIAKLGDDTLTVNALAGKITVSAPQESQILTVIVEDTDPERAANIANTLGEVFITQTQARENLRYAAPIANWQERITEIGNTIQEIEIQISEMGTPETAVDEAALSRLQTQLNEAQIRYTEAFNNLNTLQIAQAKENSNIVDIEAAVVNKNPIRPQTDTNTMLATAVGVILALSVIILIEYLDDTIKLPDEILEDTNLSTLGAIAYIKTNALEERLITQEQPRAPISEAYRMIRTNLNFATVDGGLRTVIVSSASPGEGKSTTSANLAVVIAQTGKKVVIVDADLRRPRQHKIFNVLNNQGLTTAILDNQTPINYHMQPTTIPNLMLLASGPIPPNPAELLNSHRMHQVLEALKKEADVVIFDSPPILTVADATILAPQVNGCLLVVEVGKTKRKSFREAAERLMQANVHLFGTVMNRSQPGRRGYDYYYYSNNYDYGRRKRRNGRNTAIRWPKWLSGLSKR